MIRLEIHDLADAGGALRATARCLEDAVRVGDRFRRIAGDGPRIDLVVIRILLHRRRIDLLEPEQTGRVTLAGRGIELVRIGHVIEG